MPNLISWDPQDCFGPLPGRYRFTMAICRRPTDFVAKRVFYSKSPPLSRILFKVLKFCTDLIRTRLYILICETYGTFVWNHKMLSLWVWFFCSLARALAAHFLHIDQVWTTTDRLVCLYKNEFDEMPCKLDVIEFLRWNENCPEQPYAGRRTNFASVTSVRFSKLFLKILLAEFCFTMLIPNAVQRIYKSPNYNLKSTNIS